MAAWAAAHGRPDGTENAFSAERLQPQHVKLWLAARSRQAMLNPAIPARLLWDRRSELYDPKLDLALPHGVKLWLDRHLSFGTYGQQHDDSGGDSSSSEEEADEAGEGAGSGVQFDRYGKRRGASDIARAAATRAYNLGQDVCQDDYIRPDRRGRRIRHKCTHTGFTGDALNDAKTKYFGAWEERGWSQAAAAGAAVAVA